ncbi:MAG: hypothetical protein HY903_04020 [Deltaproteobacteria bacterium]|nr:hypothetical protein [Deltaproteobacteria bacterium]
MGNFADSVVHPTMRALFQNAIRHGFGYYYFWLNYHLGDPSTNLGCYSVNYKYASALALAGAIAVTVPGAWQTATDMDDFDVMGAELGAGVLTRDEVIERSRRIIRSIAACHTGNGGTRLGPDAAGNDVGSGSSFGRQTPYFVGNAGTAGWLLNDLLPAAERDLVAHMVTRQMSDNLFDRVEYWNGADGNSFGEDEVSDALVLSLGAAIFPTDSRVAGWRRKLLVHWLGAFARPLTNTSTAIVHGQTVGELVDGFNIWNNGTLVNHSRYMPSYQAAVEWKLFTAVHWVARGAGVPRGALFNANKIYQAFVDVRFTPGDVDPITGTFINPGGSMYLPDIPENQNGPASWKYYAPNGIDQTGVAGYGYRELSVFVALDAGAARMSSASPLGTYGVDGLATVKADVWLSLHGNKLLELQRTIKADQQGVDDRRCYRGPYGQDVAHPRDVTRAPGVFTSTLGDIDTQNEAREGKCVNNIALGYLMNAIVTPTLNDDAY